MGTPPTGPAPSWIGAHVRMLEYFQGSPAILVPDNLRSGVTQACRYEPMINRTYLGFARHYGLAVVPARSGRPVTEELAPPSHSGGAAREVAFC